MPRRIANNSLPLIFALQNFVSDDRTTCILILLDSRWDCKHADGLLVCTRLTVRTTCLASHVVQPWLHICADLLQGTVLHSTLALLPTSLPTSKRVGLLEALPDFR